MLLLERICALAWLATLARLSALAMLATLLPRLSALLSALSSLAGGVRLLLLLVGILRHAILRFVICFSWSVRRPQASSFER